MFGNPLHQRVSVVFIVEKRSIDMKKKVFLMMVLGMMLCMGGAALAKTTKAVDDAVLDVRVQVAKLRGKLVYKKGQIRKLERSACGSNEELKKKVAALEEERRNSYVSVEPKLKTLYAEQDALNAEIEKLNSGVAAE